MSDYLGKAPDVIVIADVSFYKIEKQYTYRGELAIAPKEILFFPKEELIHQMSSEDGFLGGSRRNSVVDLYISWQQLKQAVTKFYQQYKHPSPAIAMITQAELQAKLEAAATPTMVFSSARLPSVKHFNPQDMTEFKLTQDGFRFYYADCDWQDFQIQTGRDALVTFLRQYKYL